MTKTRTVTIWEGRQAGGTKAAWIVRETVGTKVLFRVILAAMTFGGMRRESVAVETEEAAYAEVRNAGFTA